MSADQMQPHQQHLVEARRKLQLWDMAGVDERHRAAKIGTLVKHEPWADALQEASHIVDAGSTVVLLGKRGNGKTQMAVELIRRCCLQMQPAMYIRSREVGMALREAYKPGATKSEKQSVDHFVKPHLLVIDECQERPDSDWEIRTTTLILDKRYGSMRPTVLIANCTDQQFKNLMGASIVDRLFEGGAVIDFSWESFRR